MFNENLKAIRKSKGFTQEELAIRVNVVRQTISKYEKGLSVPDAETLQKLADVLEVNVSELLGADSIKEENKNEIAEQLARINEQLAIRNRRGGKILKTVAIIIGVIFAMYLLLAIVAVVVLSSNKSSDSEVVETVEEKEMVTDDE